MRLTGCEICGKIVKNGIKRRWKYYIYNVLKEINKTKFTGEFPEKLSE